MKKLSLLSVAGLLAMSWQAVAAPQLKLGTPSYAGTGCPAGSAAVSLSPDSQAVSVLFDSYVVEAGGSKSFDRKNCNISIPVTVPAGYSVSVMQLDYRGFLGLPQGGRAQLNVEYFLNGSQSTSRSVRTSKTFTGPYTDEYLKSDRLGIEAIVWSGCGARTNLRANTTMLVNSNRYREQAMGTVDSVDIRSGVIYHLQWKRCN